MPLVIMAGKTQELIRLADCCMAVSGSVALELMYHEKPATILYRINRPAWLVQGLFRQVRYICLVNLLASEDPLRPGRRWPGLDDDPGVIYPEFLTYENPAPQIAQRIIRWLSDPQERATCVTKLRILKQTYGQPGAASRAARNDPQPNPA